MSDFETSLTEYDLLESENDLDITEVSDEDKETINSLISTTISGFSTYKVYPMGYSEAEHLILDSETLKTAYTEILVEAATVFQIFTDVATNNLSSSDSGSSLLSIINSNNICGINEKIDETITGFSKINAKINEITEQTKQLTTLPTANSTLMSLSSSLGYYDLMNSVTNASKNINNLSNIFTSPVVSSNVIDIAGEVVDRLDVGVNSLFNAADSVVEISEYVMNLPETISNFVEEIGNVFTNFVENLKSIAETISNSLQDLLALSLPDIFSSFFSNLQIVTDIMNLIQTLEGVATTIIASATGLLDPFTKANILTFIAQLRSVVSAVKAVKKTIERYVETVKQLYNALKEQKYLEALSALLSNGASFFQKTVEYATKYPQNCSYTTQGGTQFEVDNTDGKERIGFTMKSGTYAGVINSSGDVQVSSNAGTQLITKDDFETCSMGNTSMTVKKDFTIKTSGDETIATSGNSIKNTSGLYMVNAAGGYSSNALTTNIVSKTTSTLVSGLGTEVNALKGTVTLSSPLGSVKGGINLLSPMATPNGDVNITSGGNINLKAAGVIDLKAAGGIFISGLGNVDIYSPIAVNIFANGVMTEVIGEKTVQGGAEIHKVGAVNINGGSFIANSGIIRMNGSRNFD